MRELLAGYLAAVDETADAAGHGPGLRRDLEVVSAALVHHAELRRVLTDPGIAARTRRAVLRDLLAGRAEPETIGLLSFAAAVERAGEFPIVVAQLGAELATREPAEARLGRTAGRERLRGYAARVLQELTDARDVDAVEDELFRFARILADQPALRVALADPQAPLPARHAVIEALLAQKVRDATLRLARYVLVAGQQRDLVGTFEQLAGLAAEERGRRLAEVRSAVDIDDEERDRLARALGQLVERPVDVRVVLDPSVVGGALVTVGDLIIDGTVRMRLERLRDALAP
jgi:F-type H+-transporting ATPase subunit delta